MWQISEHHGRERRGMSLADFRSRFLSICMAHRAQGRALAFAFILLDARQPHFRRALEEDAYWDALDELSGRLLTVFSFDTRRPARRPWTEPDHSIRMLVDISSYGEDLPRDVLSEHFPGLSLDRLPAVLFFQVDQDSVIDSCAVSLSTKAAAPEAAYEELAGVIGVAARSLRNVEDENAENARELYQLIVEGLHDRKVRGNLLAVYRGLRMAAGTAGILRLIGMLA